MSSAPTIDAEYMSKIGFAVGCISFADEDLDASLGELRQLLDTHGVDLTALDAEHLRVGMAQSLALAAALSNIYDVGSLETLMLTVGFLGEPDAPDLLKLKAIGLDCALEEAITLERAGLHATAAEDTERLCQIREAAAAVLTGRGIALDYFAAVGKQKVK